MIISFTRTSSVEHLVRYRAEFTSICATLKESNDFEKEFIHLYIIIIIISFVNLVTSRAAPPPSLIGEFMLVSVLPGGVGGRGSGLHSGVALLGAPPG